MNRLLWLGALAMATVLAPLLISGCPPLKEQPPPTTQLPLPPPLPVETPQTTAPADYSALATSQDFKIYSSAFANGDKMPVKYTAAGDGTSPALEWSGVPDHAVELALTLEDPDAPSGDFVHWTVYNLPPSRDRLPGALSAKPRPEGESGIMQGRNDGGKTGYFPPSPPPGKLHHYEFRLLALDAHLNLPPNATKAQFQAAVGQHALAVAQITVTYQP